MGKESPSFLGAFHRCPRQVYLLKGCPPPDGYETTDDILESLFFGRPVPTTDKALLARVLLETHSKGKNIPVFTCTDTTNRVAVAVAMAGAVARLDARRELAVTLVKPIQIRRKKDETDEAFLARAKEDTKKETTLTMTGDIDQTWAQETSLLTGSPQAPAIPGEHCATCPFFLDSTLCRMGYAAKYAEFAP
jgi:hypothetical protein